MGFEQKIAGKIGLGFRPVHYRQVVEDLPKVDWFEVITENFLGAGGRPHFFLEKLREHYPVVLHGVGLSLGSLDAFEPNYIQAWKELIHNIQPSLVSDHLCWTMHAGHNSHDLLPVPYTKESLHHISKRIQMAQDLIQRPLLIENPSAYVAFATDEYLEAEFIALLCKSTGCKILLDLNNLFVNQCNLDQDPHEYLSRLDAASVAQFHLAGHTVRDDVRIDTHDQPICDEVWALYRKAVKRWPHVPTLIEWDDHIPPLEELCGVIELARKHRSIAEQELAPVVGSPTALANPRVFSQFAAPSLSVVHQSFLSMITEPEGIDRSDDRLRWLSDQTPVDRYVGANVYNQAYYLRIKECLVSVFPCLYEVCEDAGFSVLVANYLEKHKPESINIKDVGKFFSDFIASGQFDFDFGIDVMVLAEIARIEWAESEVFDAPNIEGTKLANLLSLAPDAWDSMTISYLSHMRFLSTSYALEPVFESFKKKENPTLPEKVTQFFCIYRKDFRVHRTLISREEFYLVKNLQQGLKLVNAIERVGAEFPGEDLLRSLPAWVAKWCEVGGMVGTVE